MSAVREPIGTIGPRRRLDDLDWSLTYRPRATGDLPITLPDPSAEREHGYRTIPAQVPGAVESDLMRAGELPDLYVGRNIEQAWDLEYGDWWYHTELELTAAECTDARLLFHGLDTFATVLLNGIELGRTDNMLVAHELAIAPAAQPGPNRLVVHLTSPLRSAEAFDYPAATWQVNGAMAPLRVRKPPFMFGWDIAPRLVSAGLHRGVELVRRPPDRCVDLHLRTVAVDDRTGAAHLDFAYQLSRAPRDRSVVLTVELAAPGEATPGVVRTVRPAFLAGRLRLEVPAALLWFPRGYGAQPLYEVRVSLQVDGVLADAHTWRHGIRVVELDHVAEPPPLGRFAFRVNGVPVQVLGTNWSPLDALPARDLEREAPALALLAETGCNTVRCWGGGLYPDDTFYDWCDEHGVLVWQDFALACGRYPQDDAFAQVMADEAEAVVRRLRRHASLLVWSGSNENDDVYLDGGLDPSTDVITRTVLPSVVATHDPGRPYLPGSPTYPTALFRLGRLAPPEQHLWGPRAWYKDPYYADSQARFVSEVGFYGAMGVAALRRYLPELGAELDVDDPVLRLHETHQYAERPEPDSNRSRLLVEGARLMFGTGIGHRVDTVVPASQIAHAEATKFVIERSRLDPRRSGVIWWNLTDCWPQNTATVADYDLRPKLALHYVRRSQRGVCLVVAEADGWTHDVIVVADGAHAAQPVPCRVTDLRTGDVVLSGTAQLGLGPARVRLGRVDRRLAPTCLLLEWQVDGVPYANHYLAGEPPYDLSTYVEKYLPAIAGSADGWNEVPW